MSREPLGVRLRPPTPSLRHQFRRDRVYKPLNYLEGPQGPRVGWRGAARSSSSPPTTTSASATIPRCRGRERPWSSTAPGPRRSGSSAGPSRSTGSSRRRWPGSSAPRPRSAFVSCWNANEALPATVLTERDFVLRDQLNHASIIDAIRLAKAITKCQSGVYQHGDLADLDAKLEAGADREVKMVISDGVFFSMEGASPISPDSSRSPQARRDPGARRQHATGVLGATGRGTAEHFRRARRGGRDHQHAGQGAGRRGGGFVAGSEALCELPDPAGRPQLFSNALPCTVAGSALAAVRVARSPSGAVTRLRENTRYFREGLIELGFKPLPGETPIIPVIVGETADGHPDERGPARRRGVRHRLRLSGGAPGPGAGALPDLRCAFTG